MTTLKSLLAAATPRPWYANERFISRRKAGFGEIAVTQPDYKNEVVDAELITRSVNCIEELVGALESLTTAKALSEVRALVAGWNGEEKPDGPYERHPNKLGAQIPKTNCGAIYDLDEMLECARTILARVKGE